MALSKYELVNTSGLSGINFNGDFVKLADITDEMAEQLVGKTHILKAKTPAAVAKAQAASEKQDK
ncbi:hypothetical protein [uncultured Hymenobacter sp.]|uniref:hypothetical protein n=1 Tax=uncultured Hymenobacter sp. TaxID=170016 RepID=UPI0035CC258C